MLMLIAQHGVLTHSVWHLGENLAAHEYVEHDGDSQPTDRRNGSTQSKLCDLHILMGSLLAGDCGGPSISNSVLLPPVLATYSASRPVAQLLLIPPARAPPVLL